MNKLLFKLFVLLIIIFLLFFLFILNGCNITETTIKKEIPREINLDPIILFCPQDNCEKNLVALINYSKESVHCAFYDLRLENITKILASKSHDVDVKIVIEKNNYKEQIKGPGIKLDSNKYYMHNKFCIIDHKIIWTGSFNPTIRGSYHNNNNVIVLYSKYLAENYEDEFQEMWNGTFSSGNKVKYPVIYLNNKKIENYFCPEDNCAQHIIVTINKAKNNIYFMTFSFTNEDIADVILFKDKNIKIMGIFETTQAGRQYSQYKRLKDFGLNIIKDKNKASMHHKVFIIDNETVITGSFNPTKSADIRNDENLLIIYDKDIAEKYLQEFEKIWNLK